MPLQNLGQWSQWKDNLPAPAAVPLQHPCPVSTPLPSARRISGYLTSSRRVLFLLDGQNQIAGAAADGRILDQPAALALWRQHPWQPVKKRQRWPVDAQRPADTQQDDGWLGGEQVPVQHHDQAHGHVQRHDRHHGHVQHHDQALGHVQRHAESQVPSDDDAAGSQDGLTHLHHLHHPHPGLEPMWTDA